MTQEELKDLVEKARTKTLSKEEELALLQELNRGAEGLETLISLLIKE